MPEIAESVWTRQNERKTSMYKHHEESLEIMKKYFEEQEDVIALVFGGSVAKGCERPDSDLDGMVILTDEAYQKRVRERRSTETINGLCTYEGGYFDIKYMTKDYLRDAAAKGSEPTRNSFVKSRVLFSRDPEIEGLVAAIPVFQKGEKEDKLLSFYSDFALNYFYFLKECPVDGYMKLHAVGEVIYSLYRMILQENEILFPSNRRLEEFVAAISEETKELARLGKRFAETQEMADGDAFVEYFKKISAYQPPEDFSEVLTRYTADYEQWWRIPRPLVNEW